MNFLRPLTLVLLLTLFGFSACDRSLSGSKLTLDNYNKVTEGMSKSQVETILGKPTTMDSKDFVVLKKTTWRYEEGDKFAMITFKNDEVDGKEGNLTR